MSGAVVEASDACDCAARELVESGAASERCLWQSGGGGVGLVRLCMADRVGSA